MHSGVSNGQKLTPCDKNGTINSPTEPISKWREAAPQILAVAAKNLLLIGFGCTLGFSTILIPELQKPEPEIFVTLEELTWISSMNLILVPVGCLGSGFISQYLGRRKTMMLANGPFVAAWLLYHYAYNSTMLFCALALTGLTGGLLEAPVLTYVAEITQPHLRGMLAATSTTAVIFGVFIQLFAGSLTNWRTVALINMALPAFCFISLLMIPESPHWLIGKGRFDEAVKSLRWLRGWVSESHVNDEYNGLCESIRRPLANGELDAGDSKWKPYANRSFYVPFFLVCWGFFVGNFGGMAALQTFAVFIFSELKAPIDEYTATVLLGAAELIGTLSCVMLIHFTGKRKLSIFSTLGTSACYLIAAIYKSMLDHGTIENTEHAWLPTYALIVSAFLCHVGIRLLPWILIGEVFAPSVRSGASGASSSFAYVCTFLVNKVFLYMVNGITLAGTFWFYAVVGLVGSLVIYFILPETEGRTLREIEDHFCGIRNLNERPEKPALPGKQRWAATNPIPVTDDIESKL
ncbi:facilitated trehalose transporter Tret1 isoform X2 [Athalia rosae]|uniref:facilitated trehalose transporter Tret1 isoform X2 n=1 Tax=Athalia rosae TaxID=37344 RepID=UPI0020338B23|nr:facilitated trehalose transporter Tret1 isoform X2 [Athalia rosae]